jgi:hypothetical protein
MSVRGCLDAEGQAPGEGAILERKADLSVVGYVAVMDVAVRDVAGKDGAAADAKGVPSRIGVLRLDEAVVFDVRQGGVVYYLGFPREMVDRHGTCAACHEGGAGDRPSPHVLEERSLRPTP